MAYQWDSSLETGHKQIDHQHKQLIAALNNLIKASQSGKGCTEIFRTLDFLTGYTIKHFTDEEALQITYGYPDYLMHRQIHEDFKKTVGALTVRLHNEGPHRALVEEVITSVESWLLNHIKGDDFRMATFVKAHECL
ncbi:hemerythrin [Spirochaetia bacterium]|nr:hemerythrin [Spirochaetia bacterium]GHU36177.1 hemerythrin [Spirochaetia bacterium]